MTLGIAWSAALLTTCDDLGDGAFGDAAFQRTELMAGGRLRVPDAPVGGLLSVVVTA